MFALTIKTDNAAFQDFPAEEVARILRRIAIALEQDGEPCPITDGNGNTVGSVTFTA